MFPNQERIRSEVVMDCWRAMQCKLWLGPTATIA